MRIHLNIIIIFLFILSFSHSSYSIENNSIKPESNILSNEENFPFLDIHNKNDISKLNEIDIKRKNLISNQILLIKNQELNISDIDYAKKIFNYKMNFQRNLFQNKGYSYVKTLQYLYEHPNEIINNLKIVKLIILPYIEIIRLPIDNKEITLKIKTKSEFITDKENKYLKIISEIYYTPEKFTKKPENKFKTLFKKNYNIILILSIFIPLILFIILITIFADSNKLKRFFKKNNSKYIHIQKKSEEYININKLISNLLNLKHIKLHYLWKDKKSNAFLSTIELGEDPNNIIIMELNNNKKSHNDIQLKILPRNPHYSEEKFLKINSLIEKSKLAKLLFFHKSTNYKIIKENLSEKFDKNFFVVYDSNKISEISLSIDIQHLIEKYLNKESKKLNIFDLIGLQGIIINNSQGFLIDFDLLKIQDISQIEYLLEFSKELKNIITQKIN